MAFEQVIEGLEYAQNAGQDLTGKLHYFVKVDTDEDIILCGSGQAALGVIREENLADKPVTVQLGGIAKVSAGAAFAAGALIASDVNGQAILATSGMYAVGMALKAAGAANAIVPISMGPYGRVA